MAYFRSLLTAEWLNPTAFWLLIPVTVLVAAALVLRRWPPGSSMLRLAAFGLVIAALADPVRKETSEERQLTALLDVSASVPERPREDLLTALRPYQRDEGKISVLPFARSAAKDAAVIDGREDPADIMSRVAELAEPLDGGETNLGAALQAALSRTDSASLFILSDGFETVGNVAQLAQVAAQKGVRLFPLIPDTDAFRREQFRISSLYAPVTAQAGEIMEFRTSVENGFGEESSGKLELYVDSEKLFSQNITVPSNREKLIVVKSAPAKGGLHRLRAVFRPDRPGGGEGTGGVIERHRWVSVKEKSKILLVSGDVDDARVLKQLITQKGYNLEDIVANGNQVIPEVFEGYSTVILNNVAHRQLPGKFLGALEEFVQGGGGLLLVGGARSFGLGGYIGTKLDEMSPLKFVPPQTEKRRLTNAIALVIDKSGSMAEEGKIQAAKYAALSVVQSLKDEDFVSVIGFDAGPFVIIDVMPVGQAKGDAERRLRNLTAAGKTNLLPALATARQRLQKAGTSRKHIIVLSDGKFPLSSEAYISEINSLRNEGISISAVALGIEADIPFMKILAKYGKGAFYHTLDATQLPRIFVEDVKLATGEKTMREGVDLPVGIGPAGVRSTSVNQFPEIRGFVETLPKRGSDLELITRRDEQVFPVLGSWSYGAGKVVAFTSDANGRWSLPWLRWREFATFWGQIIEGIKDKSGAKSGEVDFDLRYGVDRKSLILDLAIFDDKLRTEAAPRIMAEVSEPGGEQRTVSLQMSRKGRFEGRLENARPGDYKIQISYRRLKLPLLGMYLDGELFGELPGRGVNVQLLESLAYSTGGRINPEPKEVQASSRVTEAREHIFIPLLALAFLLILLEAFLRELGRLPRLKRA